MISILEDIIATAGRYRAPSISRASGRIPSICTSIPSLPDPPSLLTPLLNLGATAQVANNMNKVYQARACELRERYQSAISKAQLELSKHDSPYSTSTEKQLASVLTQCYFNTLREWKEEAIAMLQKKISVLRHNAPTEHPQPKSTSFNHEYVPLLEHFFDENPFPSHADKAFLAKKSGMTYRQIHVWFQNRRRRTRRDGKTLRRKPMFDGATLPMDRLIHRMGKYIVPKAPQPRFTDATVQKSSAQFSMNGEDSPCPSNPLHAPAPPHVYPSSYPPKCLHDPFPVKNGSYKFPPPQWLRRPSATLVFHPNMDVDDLVDHFARLHVRDVDEMGTGLRKGRYQTTSMACPATYAITTTPPRAPHPALLLPSRSISRRYFPSKLPTVPAPSTHHAFEVYSQGGRPAMFAFPSWERQEAPFTSGVRHSPSAPSPRVSSLSSTCSSSDYSDDLFSDTPSCISTCPSTPDDSPYFSLRPPRLPGV